MDFPVDLSAIEGQELSSVTFVQDYVQLEFNGPVLTLFIWPEIFRSEGSYAFGEPGYRDMLCGEIANTVSTTSWETGVALEMEFESGVIFRTSLRDEDYDGPEAGHYRTGHPDDPLIVF